MVRNLDSTLHRQGQRSFTKPSPRFQISTCIDKHSRDLYMPALSSKMEWRTSITIGSVDIRSFRNELTHSLSLTMQ